MKPLLSLFSICFLASLTGLTGQESGSSNPIDRAREARTAAEQNTRTANEIAAAAEENLEAATDGEALAAEIEADADETLEPSEPGTSPDATENAVSDSQESDASPTPETEEDEGSNAEEATPEAPSDEDLVRFDLGYTDTPIRTILQNVADAAELSVVIPDTLVDNITIRLNQVTWPVLFDTVLENTGFVWERGDDGIIRVKRVGADQAINISDQGLVSVNFRNEPTRTAVQALAETVGLNIVVPAELEGSTSASLTNVTWQRVLTAILDENDYQWFEDDGIIGIRQIDSRVVLDPQTGLLNINVSSTPFQEVATLIGQTQTPVVNVVSPPEIENLPISLEVEGVTFEQALNLCVVKLPKISTGEGENQTPLTYTVYRQGPNLVQIVDSEFIANLQNEPPIVRIFDLRYASAGDLLIRIMPTPDDTTETANQAVPSFRQASDAVRPVVTGVQSVAADHANNLLMVTARPAALPEISSLIERLDQPLKQILIESKFVEITGQDQRNLGIDWASLRGWGVSAGPFTRNWSRSRSQSDTTLNNTSRSNSFSDVTTRNFQNDNVFNSTDESGRSTNFDSTVDSSSGASNSSNINNTNGFVTTEDISDTFNNSETNTIDTRGNDSSFGQTRDIVNGTLFNRDITNSAQSSSSFSRAIENIATTARTDTAIFQADQFRLVLSALEEESDAKLITNPNVVAINGKQASVELTDYFYKPGPVETSEGVTTRGEPEPLEPRPGTTLKVTPTVVGGQLISLNVIPQVNSIISNQTIDGNVIPVVRRRATESEVLLRSGSTLAIGGLITDQNTKDTNKVPVLGDIPILGRLFSSESTDVQTTNQIIFITASLLNPQTDTYMDVVGIDRFNSLGLTDREVQGVGARQMTPEEAALQQAVREARNEAAREELIERLRIRKKVDDSIDAEEREAAPDDSGDGKSETDSSGRKSSPNFGPISRR